jgi:hypothetical protein
MDKRGNGDTQILEVLGRGGATVSAVVSVHASRLKVIDSHAVDILLARNDRAAFGMTPHGNLYRRFFRVLRKYCLCLDSGSSACSSPVVPTKSGT